MKPVLALILDDTSLTPSIGVWEMALCSDRLVPVRPFDFKVETGAADADAWREAMLGDLLYAITLVRNADPVALSDLNARNRSLGDDPDSTPFHDFAIEHSF